jgi:hypothetical protein
MLALPCEIGGVESELGTPYRHKIMSVDTRQTNGALFLETRTRTASKIIPGQVLVCISTHPIEWESKCEHMDKYFNEN